MSGAGQDIKADNLALESTLQLVKNLLTLIETNTASISIDADTINLNTDQLEALIALTNTALANLQAIVSTSANQVTINSNLVSIAGYVDGIESLLTTLNAKDFATQTTLAALNAKLNALGQNTMANSMPVVLASDQSSLPINVGDSTKQTYSATIIGLVPVASATDVFTIIGSATKTIKIKRVIITATKTASGIIDVVLVKRSTANTLGTSTTPTIVPHDSNNAAATAVVRAYTANATLGTLVGNIFAKKLLIQGGANETGLLDIDFTSQDRQPIVLRGIAQLFGINFNATGITLAGGSVNAYIEYTEE